MSITFLAFSIIYVLIAFVFLIFGVMLTCINAEYGKEDEDYQYGRLLLRLWLIWPVCLVRIVKAKIAEAEGEEDESWSDRS